MARARRLDVKARNNLRGLRFAELTSLVEAFGYALDRIRDSHHLDYHPAVPEFLNSSPTGMAWPSRIR